MLQAFDRLRRDFAVVERIDCEQPAERARGDRRIAQHRPGCSSGLCRDSFGTQNGRIVARSA